MKTPYLVQRLNNPMKIEGKMAVLAEGLSFGGGLRNGGFTKETMDLLRSVWSFDYMGSSEFEWGAVPKALEKMLKAGGLVSFDFEAKTKEGKKATIYVIAPPSIKEDVKAWILAKAKDEYAVPGLRTKETVGLQTKINGADYRRNLCGWLELDTGFLFFIDKEMFEKATELFEVKPESKLEKVA